MGLDLVPLGRPKPGHEAEWERLMAPLYDEREESEADRDRRAELSILAYEAVGAPRVGTDPDADAWALERKPDDSELDDSAFLSEMKDYYVLQLVEDCDGVPRYSNGGFYDGVDETCFRGAFLKDCEGLMGKALLSEAWTSVMRPAEAAAYGRKLLDVADRAERGEIMPPPLAEARRGWLRRLLGFLSLARKQPAPEPAPLEDQLDILRSAGRWYVYWGEKGHPIWAYF